MLVLVLVFVTISISVFISIYFLVSTFIFFNFRSAFCVAGFAPEEGKVEVIALSRGKSRNRPMAPTYILAVDHLRREVVLAVRGTKAFGDAITITHFRPEPFLDGYVAISSI